MGSSKPHAVLVASPGIGHLIPVLELGHRLVTNHGFNVTILAMPSPTSAAEAQFLQLAMAANLLNIVELPPVDISRLVDPDATMVTKLAVMMREAVPSVRSAISAMTPCPKVLIVDLFGTESLVIGDEFMLPKYVFLAPNAWFAALTVYTPTLDKVVEGEYVAQKEPLQIPGCKPLRPEDVVDPMLDRTNQQYREFVRIASEISLADVILLNTWEDLEPTTLKAFREDKILSQVIKAPVYPIGPLVRPVFPAGSKREVLNWLDMQPKESVIYVSFGSGGTPSAKQISELAWGLELSQQRFIWVVRPPNDEDATSSYFTSGSGCGPDDPSDYLPDGFLARTHDVGLVVPEWAPQMEILSHPSVGAILSHCGWNSSLESIVNGVPMIACPLYAEQRLNATMMVEELGVAVRPKVLPLKKVVDREEIEMMVRRIMAKEGNAMRDRVKELQHSAAKALCEGGSSYSSLSQVAKLCEMSFRSPKAN